MRFSFCQQGFRELPNRQPRLGQEDNNQDEHFNSAEEAVNQPSQQRLGFSLAVVLELNTPGSLPEIELNQ